MRSPAYVIRHSPGPAVGVAAFTALAILMTMLVAGTLLRSAGTDPQKYTAVFSDSNGLIEGDDVRMAGVRVGRVEKRELKDGRAYVTFTVSGDQAVYADSRAEINFLNLIGQRYVDITRGSARHRLPPGATIPVSRTSPGLDLTALFNAFKPLFDLLRPADVNKLATQITAVLQGQGPTINDLMAQTAKLTSHLAQRDEVIGRVITNMSVVMETTAAHRKDLGVLISELGKLTHGLAGDRKQIGTALDSMSGLSIAMDDLVRRTRKPLTTDIRHVNTLGGLVNKQTDILTKGLKGTPRLLDAYARSMSYGSWLNTYICSLSIHTPDGRTMDGRHVGGNTKACQ
jgi:phospholipid/cholesterol/gamma-HCH transport system substrate-binding protein